MSVPNLVDDHDRLGHRGDRAQEIHISAHVSFVSDRIAFALGRIGPGFDVGLYW